MLIGVLAVSATVHLSIVFADESGLVYPATRRSKHVDDYHGTRIHDPYRWLECLESDETKAWIRAQNKVTFNYLANVPEREQLKERLGQLWSFERYRMPVTRGGHSFYLHNSGSQNHDVLFVGSEGEPPRVLLDPNQLSAKGSVALTDWTVSGNGERLAYRLNTNGSDHGVWRVMEVATGRHTPDRLKLSSYAKVSWNPDGSGFYYGSTRSLFYHEIGRRQEDDVEVYREDKHRKGGLSGEVTGDGKHLLITVKRGRDCRNKLLWKSLEHPEMGVRELGTGYDAEYIFLGCDDSSFWILTDLDAPFRRVMAVDISRPERRHWREVIPEADRAIRSASLVGNRLFVSYLEDATTQVHVFDLSGRRINMVELPGPGTAGGFRGGKGDDAVFYWFTNFVTPKTTYRYDLRSGKSTVHRRPVVDFDADDFITEQVFYRGKDGTRVPMFITHRKHLKLDGDNPTLLEGYGGFDISMTPRFCVRDIPWLEMGGVYAVANLRGGGEYGRDWHQAGVKQNKQTTFDDFIAAAKWLIENKYTCRKKLAIRGGSNGGLLVGAAMTQRPDLFAAAVAEVGLFDMLRYHKFTVGWAWEPEYGSSDDPTEFKTLLDYSPLHNVKPGTEYPATLLMTAEFDDRVLPAHSFKFAAALQHAQAGGAPVLIRTETGAGHDAGTPVAKRVDAAADSVAFLLSVLNPPEPE